MRTTCIYICHVYQDTSPLRYVSTTRTFDIYVRHDIMLTFTYFAPPSQAQGYVYESALWVYVCVCGEVPHIQPCPKLERVQAHVTVLKDMSHLICVCDSINNPNSGVTLYFLKYSSHMLHYFSGRGKAPMHG